MIVASVSVEQTVDNGAENCWTQSAGTGDISTLAVLAVLHGVQPWSAC